MKKDSLHRNASGDRQEQTRPAGPGLKYWVKNSGSGLLTILLGLMLLFGLVMVASAQMNVYVSDFPAWIRYLAGRLVYALLGGFAYAFLWVTFSSKWLEKINLAILTAVLFVYSLLMVVPFFFQAINGSHAWILLGGMSLQPSEFGKPLLIFLLMYCGYRSRQIRPGHYSIWKCWWPVFVFLAVSAVLLVMQKDIGSLVITLAIGLIGLALPSRAEMRKVRITVIVLFVVGFAAMAGMIVFHEQLQNSFLGEIGFISHIFTRIDNMLNPYLDIHAGGFQPANGLYGLAENGLSGNAFGVSIRKAGYLTQADSDYILVVIVEELGLFGLLLVTALTGAVFVLLMMYAQKNRAVWYQELFVCSACYLALHFVINVGGVSCLIPMTGVPILMVSSGGSSTMACCAVMGMCQGVIREFKWPGIKKEWEIRQTARLEKKKRRNEEKTRRLQMEKEKNAFHLSKLESEQAQSVQANQPTGNPVENDAARIADKPASARKNAARKASAKTDASSHPSSVLMDLDDWEFARSDAMDDFESQWSEEMEQEGENESSHGWQF